MATIFEDDFNSYENGDLVGQGGWLHRAYDTGVIDVQDSVVFEGAKAISAGNTTKYERVKKQGTAQADGKITVYMRHTHNDIKTIFQVMEGETICFNVYLHSDGNITYYNGSFHTLLSGYQTDHWYCIEIEWRSSDHKVRYRIDGGDWSDWVNPWNTWSAGVDRIDVQMEPGVGKYCYLDYIAENPYVPVKPRSHGYIF